MNPARLPIAAELFAQWRRARGEREVAASRPFSRNWETLLEDADIVSALDRADAERDIRSLAADGWVSLKSVRYRANLLDRVVIPLAQEDRWKTAFGLTPPTDDEARRLQEYPWQPELAFLRDARVNLSFAELQRLDAFLAGGGRAREIVPIKERSLQIFGDEKRLDVLTGSSLIREDRLLLKHLRCEWVAEPMGWKRGPASAAAGPVLVLENAATWHSYDRWNQAVPQFSAVIYGRGNRFADGLGFLAEIFRELGGPRPILYFGDLDPAGLQIPQLASRNARQLGLPEIRPHLPSYRWLLTLTERALSTGETPGRREDCEWLGEMADEAWAVLSAGKRLAQEHIGWEFLRTPGVADDAIQINGV